MPRATSPAGRTRAATPANRARATPPANREHAAAAPRWAHTAAAPRWAHAPAAPGGAFATAPPSGGLAATPPSERHPLCAKASRYVPWSVRLASQLRGKVKSLELLCSGLNVRAAAEGPDSEISAASVRASNVLQAYEDALKKLVEDLEVDIRALGRWRRGAHPPAGQQSSPTRRQCD